MVDRRPLGNVLVATDFSDGAKRALDRACHLPITPGSAITLLHVMPRLHPSFAARAELAARGAVEELAEEARQNVAASVDVFAAVEIGEPFVEIGRRAEAQHAELIVLGRHGRRAWPERVLGSTAERVLRRGSTPVLVVAGKGVRPYRRPLVGVDKEGSATSAIELAARMAPQARGALAIHVVDSDEWVLLAQYELPQRELDEHQRSLRERTRKAIELALDELGGTEVDFDLRLVEGDPGTAILESARAEQADLVVVGTHGRSGLRHLLVGSVAEAVIRGADRDVLAARPLGGAHLDWTRTSR